MKQRGYVARYIKVQNSTGGSSSNALADLSIEQQHQQQQQ